MRLAVFDYDGTLVDSQANIVRAMERTFADAKLPPPDPHAVRRVVGLSLVQAMEMLLPDAEAARHARLAEAYKRVFQQMRANSHLEQEPLFTGIPELLEQLRNEGWLLAVATGKSDRGLQYTLEHHGIHDRFISLQTADRHPSKPHPSMLLQCLADAGVGPDAAAIIGDTVFDMGMGAAAGVRGIGVEWGYHDPGELLAAGAIGVAGDAAQLKALLDG